MALAVRLSQGAASPSQDDAFVRLCDTEAGSVVLGESRDAQGLPLPIVPSRATLFGPRGCCLIARGGPLWVADTGHHRLLGWRDRPSVDGISADWVIGQPDFSLEGRNGKTTPGPTTLNVPTSVAAYGEGLAVADAWNHRVLLWQQAPSGSHCPPDFVLGQKTFQDTLVNRGKSTPSADSLYWPYGVSAWENMLAVADTGNRRVLIWLTPPASNGQPADLVLGQVDFHRRDENAGGMPNDMSMRWPHAIARWQEGVCVADAGNNRIMVWESMPSECGVGCRWILGQTDAEHVDHNAGGYWPHAGSLNMPYGVAARGDWLFVADTANSRLLGWHKDERANGAKAGALAAQSTFNEKGDNQWMFATRDTLCWPYGLAIYDELLAIADSGNNRVVLRSLHDEVLG